MINKVVGYGGFNSYSACPYPTIKQGKQIEQKNEVWSSTRREADKINPNDNFNHYHSVYKKNHLENTQPKDYHPEHVPKGSSSTLNFAGTSLVRPYDQVQSQKEGQPAYRNGFNLLKTGTEHWKTNYQGSVCEPSQVQAGETSVNAVNARASSGNKNPRLIDEQLSKALSYKNRPYVNEAKTGVTDYKYNFGETIGSHPKEILNESSSNQPIRDHPLKYGTNQLWTEVPGYMGFKPAEVPFGQLKTKIEDRNSHDRGQKKLQLGDNYHVNVPGYGGYKPMINVGKAQVRESCFQFHKQ